jgi:hypothetical protein
VITAFSMSIAAHILAAMAQVVTVVFVGVFLAAAFASGRLTLRGGRPVAVRPQRVRVRARR